MREAAFPPLTDADIGLHPRIGAQMACTHIILGFKSPATVSQANAALQAAQVSIIGGLPMVSILLVAAADTPDFSGLDAAIQSLRADPSVEFAARSLELTLSEVPRAAESGISAPRPSGLNWTWSVTSAPTSGPFGDGGNWALEASRFPQAWNLLEAIRRNGASVDIGIVDGAFEFGHGDLSALSSETLCTTVVHKCNQNNKPATDHGNHVAGIIGADFDNDSNEAGLSRGVSGADPLARMHGVPSSFGGPSIFLAETHVEVWKLVLARQEAGANWRGINYNMGGLVADLPQAEVESPGRLDRAPAQRAARDGGVIGPAAGNDNSARQLQQ